MRKVLFFVLCLLSTVAPAQDLISSGSGPPTGGSGSLSSLCIPMNGGSYSMKLGSTALNRLDWTTYLGNSCTGAVQQTPQTYAVVSGEWGLPTHVVTNDGDATTPAWGFALDTNTGFYRVASDQIGVTTGAARSLNFTGNGIIEGTTGAPTLKLNNSVGACIDFNATAFACAASNSVTLSANTIVSMTAPSVSIASAGSALQLGGRTHWVNTAPTISSGFGTSPSIAAGISSAAFSINVGTGGTATSGVIGLPTATTGWHCTCTDITTQSSTVFLCKQKASSTTSATIANYNTAGAEAAWVASNILHVTCTAF